MDKSEWLESPGDLFFVTPKTLDENRHRVGSKKEKHELEFTFDATGHPIHIQCGCGDQFSVSPKW